MGVCQMKRWLEVKIDSLAFYLLDHYIQVSITVALNKPLGRI